MFVSYEDVYKYRHARTKQCKTCKDCITPNSSVCVYRNETKLCTWVARGKILTVTERFSKLNSYNTCNNVIDGENRTYKLPVLKSVLSLHRDC